MLNITRLNRPTVYLWTHKLCRQYTTEAKVKYATPSHFIHNTHSSLLLQPIPAQKEVRVKCQNVKMKHHDSH